MIADVLEPQAELLSEEYVLVQAWKKTASHIRYHNWYSDTLELDRIAVNLPGFLTELAEQLRRPDQWNNDPLRIVPAPKSQQWRVAPATKDWEPVDKRETATKLRPLAHVSLKDQVAATAVMLCLANRVETMQGDPRAPIGDVETRKKVVSYGNRLFCDAVDSELHHRWGSTKLYRAYYQDYQSFLSRPEIAAEAVSKKRSLLTVIVQADLNKFFDRVRPTLLAQKIDGLARPKDDPRFFTLVRRILNWGWHKEDSREVAEYAKRAKIQGFSKVALPQGLVASGFLANLTLLDFDDGLRGSLSHQIAPGIYLVDACRYVDDLRIVLTVKSDTSLPDIERRIKLWLRELLDRHAMGLKPSDDKMKASAFRDDIYPLVRQSRKMARIQSAISGGFDAIGGEEILGAIQGLVRSQQRYSQQRTEDQAWSFSPIPDVGDETVARFAAGRFRSTYRSLRPLLGDEDQVSVSDSDAVDKESPSRSRVPRTRIELDDEARAFALGLIENWVEDPSNVRLLRIGLDLWPAVDILRAVLDLLRPFTKTRGRRRAQRQVAWYCMAEIFRAGATETGFVRDDESLPEGIDVADYRSVLWKEGVRLASLAPSTLPWYLKQQILLFLAASDTRNVPIIRVRPSTEIKHYRQLIRFLKNEQVDMTDQYFATLSVLSRRAYRGQEMAGRLVARRISPHRLEKIAERDPSFALELLSLTPNLAKELSPRLRADLCIGPSVEKEGWVLLSDMVLNGGPNNPLRNEVAILKFALKFLVMLRVAPEIESITPSNILLKLPQGQNQISEFEELKLLPGGDAGPGSMYHPPPWCSPDERWRFHLGYLLRFILAGRQDFTIAVRPVHWKESTPSYRAPESHWYQRLYGLFNGHSAFGDDWLPISDWTEQLLSALLNWPGCRTSRSFDCVRRGVEDTYATIERHLEELLEIQGPSASALMIQLIAPRIVSTSGPRPLRACVVQTVIPRSEEFDPADLTLSAPAFRRLHRNHLSAALAAVERMLDLRETHKGRGGRLDWLILPELSVHPRDVQTHLVPFARAHKAIILAGLTYEELFAGQPFVNSAIWIIPAWSSAHGLQILIRRQGKQHLAPAEGTLNKEGPLLQGFRPCQWLVGYEWSDDGRPLWLTASVCYDATDLSLVSDLCHLSDVFTIPALNKDVSTFDQMALALHYHMFQLVIVANNGQYGGSNAYLPYQETHARQVFHMHGQPQATVAFLEIDDIAAFIARKVEAKKPSKPAKSSAPTRVKWKFPPAGM